MINKIWKRKYRFEHEIIKIINVLTGNFADYTLPNSEPGRNELSVKIYVNLSF